MKDLKKENIENLSYKDIANLILEKEKKGLNTLDLFTNIVNLSTSSTIVFISSSCFFLFFECKSILISAYAFIIVNGVFKS